MSILQKLLKPKPWQELEKNFKMELQCEECGFQTKTLFTVSEVLCCTECRDAKIRRARLLQADEEWEAYEKENQE